MFLYICWVFVPKLLGKKQFVFLGLVSETPCRERTLVSVFLLRSNVGFVFSGLVLMASFTKIPARIAGAIAAVFGLFPVFLPFFFVLLPPSSLLLFLVASPGLLGQKGRSASTSKNSGPELRVCAWHSA